MNAQLWMQKIAEVAPDIHQALDETVPLVRESPFREEIVQELDGLFKRADEFPLLEAMKPVPFRQRAQGFGEDIGANIAQSVATSLANDAFDAVKRGITKGWYYRKMLKNNPDLQKKDARMVKQVFSTLHRYNPEYTADPWVAGTWVRDHTNLATLGSIDIGTVNQIVGARKNIVDVKKMPMSQRMWQTPEEKQLEQLHIQKAQMEVSPHAQKMENLRLRELTQRTDEGTFEENRRRSTADTAVAEHRADPRMLGLDRKKLENETALQQQKLRMGPVQARMQMMDALRAAQEMEADYTAAPNAPRKMTQLTGALKAIPGYLRKR